MALLLDNTVWYRLKADDAVCTWEGNVGPALHWLMCHRLSTILLPRMGPGITASPESYRFLCCRDVVQVTKHGHILSYSNFGFSVSVCFCCVKFSFLSTMLND